MRVKVFSQVDERDGREPALDLSDGANHYRVRFYLGGRQFDIVQDERNGLIVREVEGRQMHVEPRASNEVRISAEKWK